MPAGTHTPSLAKLAARDARVWPNSWRVGPWLAWEMASIFLFAANGTLHGVVRCSLNQMKQSWCLAHFSCFPVMCICLCSSRIFQYVELKPKIVKHEMLKSRMFQVPNTHTHTSHHMSTSASAFTKSPAAHASQENPLASQSFSRTITATQNKRINTWLDIS